MAINILKRSRKTLQCREWIYNDNGILKIVAFNINWSLGADVTHHLFRWHVFVSGIRKRVRLMFTPSSEAFACFRGIFVHHRSNAVSPSVALLVDTNSLAGFHVTFWSINVARMYNGNENFHVILAGNRNFSKRITTGVSSEQIKIRVKGYIWS